MQKIKLSREKRRTKQRKEMEVEACHILALYDIFSFTIELNEQYAR
jgi:hypothetical protein